MTPHCHAIAMNTFAKVRGENPDALTARYIRLLNDAIRDRPANMTIGVHMCRGNLKGTWMAEGGYEPIAERLFNQATVDAFFLEFDTPRAGDFAPLRHVPKNKTVVLGLISSKTPVLENGEDIKRRINDAARFSKLFIKAKNNLAPDIKALRYGFGVKTVGRDPKLGVDIDAPYIVWHPQHVEITANEAMQAAEGRTAKREAREFLLDRLEAGSVKQNNILDEAKQEGIAERTLRRAKKDLGIKSWKERGKADGDWFWELSPKKMTNAP
jgi:hypothetical protein